MPPAQPPPTRSSALMFLSQQATFVSDTFFTPNTERVQELPWNFGGRTLLVRMRTYSQAEPVNITYEIYLQGLMPKRLGYFLAFVLYPQADAGANRRAFKRCLEDLASDPGIVSSQHDARE